MQVTFHEQIKCKTVTLEGDVFDPSGTLTGGSRPSSTPILAMLQELNTKRARLSELEKEVSDKSCTCVYGNVGVHSYFHLLGVFTRPATNTPLT